MSTFQETFVIPTESAAQSVGLEGYFHIAYAAQARGLKAWLDGDADYHSKGTQTRHAVEIMMAIYPSARDREVVRLPLTVQDYPLSLMLT